MSTLSTVELKYTLRISCSQQNPTLGSDHKTAVLGFDQQSYGAQHNINQHRWLLKIFLQMQNLSKQRCCGCCFVAAKVYFCMVTSVLCVC